MFQSSTHHRFAFIGLLTLVVILILGSGYALRRRIIDWWMEHHPLPTYTEVIQDDGTYSNILFLHHSVGEALIREGGLRQALHAKGFALWDHDYNQIGLTRPDGTRAKAMYNIPDLKPGSVGGNTDPDGLAMLFAQPAHRPPDNALSRILQHPVIVFKSCFPNSAIRDEAMLEHHKTIYLGIRNTIQKHPDRVFILLTSPPLHPKATTPDQARRAQSLSDWLVSENFRQGCPNLYVMDFRSLLVDPRTGMLRDIYQVDPASGDSHPNKVANQAVAPLLVDFIDRSVQDFRSTHHLNK